MARTPAPWDRTCSGTCSGREPTDQADLHGRVEKYRPVALSDVSGHHDILATITRFVESNRVPHLLFYGPPGTGKTSTILALARRIYGAANMRQMTLELNASDDRGIDVVREQIKTFASTRQIFSASAAGSAASSAAGFKLIVLDEADAMTNAAQMALRRIMEKYTAHTRFCIIANYAHKLSPAVLSRCTRFRFSPLKEPDIRALVDKVVDEEGVKIMPEATDALVRLSKGDMRRALNVLQACHACSEFCRWIVREFPSEICSRKTIRHTPPSTRRAPRAGKRHSPRDHNDRDHLQLRGHAAAGGRPEAGADAAGHERRHDMPQHDQHAQGSAGPGAGRHHHCRVGGVGEVGGQAPGDDHVARGLGGYRTSSCRRSERDHPDGSSGGRDQKRGRAVVLS